MDEKDQAQRFLSQYPCHLGIYRHYKGGLYTLYSYTLDEETLETKVHYYSHAKRTRWTRAQTNFGGSAPSGEPRFNFVRAATVDELRLALLDGVSGFEMDVEHLRHFLQKKEEYIKA